MTGVWEFGGNSPIVTRESTKSQMAAVKTVSRPYFKNSVQQRNRRSLHIVGANAADVPGKF